MVSDEHHRQQFDVCQTEIEFERVGDGEPAEGVVFERLGFGGGGGFAVDERQMDRAVGIGVGDRRADLRVDDRKRDLLHALAGKGLFGRLAGFDLASDEFPLPTLRLPERTPAEEILVPAADDAAYDFYNSRIVAHAKYYTKPCAEMGCSQATPPSAFSPASRNSHRRLNAVSRGNAPWSALFIVAQM